MTDDYLTQVTGLMRASKKPESLEAYRPPSNWTMEVILPEGYAGSGSQLSADTVQIESKIETKLRTALKFFILSLRRRCRTKIRTRSKLKIQVLRHYRSVTHFVRF